MSFLVLELQDSSQVNRVREVLAAAGLTDVHIRNLQHAFPGQARIGGMTCAYGEHPNSGPCDLFVVTRQCGVETPRMIQPSPDHTVP